MNSQWFKNEVEITDLDEWIYTQNTGHKLK